MDNKQDQILDAIARYLLSKNTPVPLMVAAMVSTLTLLEGITDESDVKMKDVLTIIERQLSRSADHDVIREELNRQKVLISSK
jgi:phage terminase small subunit